MALSEGMMQVIWVAGMIIIPICVYLAAKKDFYKGYQKGIDDVKEFAREKMDEIKKEIPNYIEKAQKSVDGQVDRAVDRAVKKADEMIDRRVKEFMKEDGPLDEVLGGVSDMIDEKVKAIFTENNIKAIGEMVGEAVGHKLLALAASSRGGQSKRSGGGVVDIIGGIFGIDGASDLVNFAKNNPERAASFLKSAAGGNGPSSSPGSGGGSWT